MKAKITKREIEKSQLLKVGIGYAAAPASRPAQPTKGPAAGGQEISGDAAISCTLPDGSVALILSDGMGKGQRAAAESNLVVGMLRRRLKQGRPVASAIREVNGYLLQKERGQLPCHVKETFATVDLAVIDRRTGRARFYKMGAAPSYVVRRGSGGSRRVRKLEQPALPVGIIPTLKLTHVTARLHAGDLIVIMSDGIGDMAGLGEDDWIEQLLSEVPEEEGPRQLANRILQEAQKRRCSRETDDATVAVAVLR
ncbi:MAG: SpoIIE family protein phosphatase [Firmicutes bacterium]|nr:SpoIIE family protein phosphatase [Bacillota bacterium]